MKMQINANEIDEVLGIAPDTEIEFVEQSPKTILVVTDIESCKNSTFGQNEFMGSMSHNAVF